MKCIKCGKSISANSKFCPYCGEEISADCRRKIKENPINKGNGEIQWYYYNNEGQRFGPIPYDIVVKLVKLGTIQRDTYVWHDGLEDWSRADSMGLFSSGHQIENVELNRIFDWNRDNLSEKKPNSNNSNCKRNKRILILAPILLFVLCVVVTVCLISIPEIRKVILPSMVPDEQGKKFDTNIVENNNNYNNVNPNKTMESELQNENENNIPHTIQTNDREEPDNSALNHSMDIGWKEFTLNCIDGYGYEITARVKFSPWILQSDEKTLSDVWNQIGAPGEPMHISDWGFSRSGKLYRKDVEYGYPWESYLTDMYYSIGSIYLENITDGWDFSDDNIGIESINILGSISGSLKSGCIVRVFFSNGYKDYSTFDYNCKIISNMHSNKWGPVVFVIAHSETFSPEYPEGEAKEKLKNTLFTIMLNGKSENGLNFKEFTIDFYK